MYVWPPDNERERRILGTAMMTKVEPMRKKGQGGNWVQTEYVWEEPRTGPETNMEVKRKAATTEKVQKVEKIIEILEGKWEPRQKRAEASEPEQEDLDDMLARIAAMAEGKKRGMA